MTAADPAGPSSLPPLPLPPLREELRLIPAGAGPDGAPAWMIHDPVVNRFYRICWRDFELLLRWELGSAAAVAEGVTTQTLLSADCEDVAGLVQFLTQHQLLKIQSERNVDRLRQRARQLRRSPAEWLLHNYLFVRIPLIKPQYALKRLLSTLGWIYTPAFAACVMVLSAVGMFLAARQWETFKVTFLDHLTVQGLVGYAVALSCAKALHELGHALTATRYGVRVAHMGVAFLVMFPMLYTDTSESWKLSRARERLAIASAGLITEIGLAGIATLAWSLAPEGAVRSACFFLATVSWLMTLAVNASPFMRFDGYFILSDLLDFPNLHERAGAMARARLRRILLGWTVPDPEHLPGRRNAWLATFALITWVYRLTVFFGIALLVYHYFFKLLGACLMMVELVWFIARPVYGEFAAWNAGRHRILTSRRIAFAVVVSSLFLVLLVPWRGGIHGPGWVHAERQQVVYSPLPGRIVALPTGTQVAAGEPLFVLASPDLSLAGDKAQVQAEARQRELLGLAGLPGGEERRAQVQSQHDAFVAETLLYRGESQRLQLTAPFAGQLMDVDPELARGVWVQPSQPLAILVDPTQWVVEAFIREADIARVQPGQAARVQGRRQGLGFLRGRVTEVDTNRVGALPNRILDAQGGGPIVTLPPTAAEKRTEGAAPRDSLYRVKILLLDPPGSAQMMLGNVVIDAEGQALLPSALRRLAAVLVRESGF